MSLLLNRLTEAVLTELKYSGFKSKQKSITRLFPKFPERKKAIYANGGIRLSEQFPELWWFKVASGTQSGVEYDVYLHFKNILDTIKQFVGNKELWTKDGLRCNLNKLAPEVFNQVDLAMDCSCLTADTKIPLLDSRVLTIAEILSEFGTDREFWIYSSDENGNFIPKKARCLGVTGLVTNLVEVTLDNDETVKCTSDHRFRMRDGSYREAGDLKENDSLMPIYFSKTSKVGESKYSQTYTTVKENYSSVKKDHGTYRTIHRVVAETVLKDEYEAKYRELIETNKEKYLVVHHRDFNSLNNDPSNLQWMGKLEHWFYHANLGKENCILGTKAYHADPENKETVREARRRAGKICQEKHPDAIDKCNAAGIAFMKSDEGRELTRQKNIKRWEDPKNHIKQSKAVKEGRTVEGNLSISEKKKAWWAAHPERRLAASQRMKSLNQTLPRNAQGGNNHKVKSIKFLSLEKQIPVYDLFVEGTNNFALDVGVYVHNCPADLWWGPKFQKTQKQAQFGGDVNIAPNVRNPKQYGLVCKHQDDVLERLPFYTGDFSRHLKTFYEREIQQMVDEIRQKEEDIQAKEVEGGA